MKANTRQEVIDQWQEGSGKYLDYFTCPNCRDILQKSGDILRCKNSDCFFEGIFSLTGEWLDPIR